MNYDMIFYMKSGREFKFGCVDQAFLDNTIDSFKQLFEGTSHISRQRNGKAFIVDIKEVETIYYYPLKEEKSDEMDKS